MDGRQIDRFYDHQPACSIDSWEAWNPPIFVSFWVTRGVEDVENWHEFRLFPECVIRVPVSLWGFGGWGYVRSTLRLRPQPSATLCNRPQPSAWRPYGRAVDEFCKRGHSWGFKRRAASFRVAGDDVSKDVLCGRRNTFAWFWEDELHFYFFVARAALWRPPSSFCVAGARLQTCRGAFLANHIVRAAWSGDNVQIPWQAWRWVTCDDTPHSTLYTPQSAVYTLHFTLCTPHSTLYTPNFILPTLYPTLYTLHSTLHTYQSRRYTPHFTLPLHALHSALYTPPFTHCTPPSTVHTPHFTICTFHSTLHTLHLTLHTLHSSLHTLHTALYTLHSTLCALHSALYTLHSTLYTFHSTLYTPHFTDYLYTLDTPHFTLYTPHFTLYTPHFTLHTLHFTLYTPHSTLYTPHFTLHTPHFTLYTWHSTLPTPRFTLYTPHFTLYTPHFTLYTSHFTLHSSLPAQHPTFFTLDTLHSTPFHMPQCLAVHWCSNMGKMHKTVEIICFTRVFYVVCGLHLVFRLPFVQAGTW